MVCSAISCKVLRNGPKRSVSDFDEKTRVTVVVPNPPEEGANRRNDCLVVIYTKEATLLGKRFVLEQNPTRAGRGADNQIVLDGDSVSRRHCHFERRGEAWLVVDDGSTNGTYVNDDHISSEHRLANGDRIKVGPTIFKFLSGTDVESQYHEEIYRLTIIDGLTQAYNKRYLFEALGAGDHPGTSAHPRPGDPDVRHRPLQAHQRRAWALGGRRGAQGVGAAGSGAHSS